MSLARADDAPVLRAVELRGCTVYSRERLLRIVRLEPGRPVPSEPAAVARSLETRYHDDGYPAASVRAELDASSATLVVTVDEGRLAELEAPGLRGRALSRALTALDLEPGRIVRDADVDAALWRVEDASRGALVRDEPAYEVERTPAGVKLLVRLRRRRLQPSLRLDRVGTQAIHDRVSGWAPRLGLDLRLADLGSYDHATAYGQLAYGIDAEQARFTAGVWRPFGGGRLVAGYEFHDLTDTDDEFRVQGISEAPGSALGFSDFKDHFQRRGHEAHLLARLAPRLRAGLAFRADEYSSLPAVTGSESDPPTPNPPADAGPMRSLIVSLQWASRGGSFDDPREAQRTALLRSPYGRPLPQPPPFALWSSFEWASPDLGGDFSFRRFIAEARTRHPLTSVGTLSARLLLGVAGGEVPVQKRFALGGLGTLRAYEEKEFDGLGLALANLEWRLQLARLLPDLIPFADAGATWDGETASDGVRADLGLGLRWPPMGGLFVRVDGAVAVTRGGHGLRITGLLQVPF